MACVAAELTECRDAAWRECDAQAAAEAAAEQDKVDEQEDDDEDDEATLLAATREAWAQAEARAELVYEPVDAQAVEQARHETRAAAATALLAAGGGGGAGLAALGATLQQISRAEEPPGNPLLLPTLHAQLAAQLKQLVLGCATDAGSAAEPSMRTGDAAVALPTDVLDTLEDSLAHNHEGEVDDDSVQ